MKTVSKILFSHATMAILMIILGISMGWATFIENDYSTITAKALIYNTRWFEILWILLTINMFGATFKNKLYTKEKLAVLVFHLAFIVMILGAGITRYFSFEGNIAIREGLSENTMTTTTNYFSIKTKVDSSKTSSEKEVFLSPWVYVNDAFSVKNGSHEIDVTFKDFVPNAIETLQKDEKGDTYIHIFVSDGMFGAKKFYIKKGDFIKHGDVSIGFESKENTTVNFNYTNNQLNLKLPFDISATSIWKTNTDSIKADSNLTVNTDVIYRFGKSSFLVKGYMEKCKPAVISFEGHEGMETPDGVVVDVTVDGKTENMVVYGEDNAIGKVFATKINGVDIEMTYGAKQIKLPFSVKLNDFVVERYPGSMSPSSFRSEVELIDKEQKINEKHSIYMNHIMNHRGYRFFQSSYDPDEQGTILSVNYDAAGTFVSYLGYLLMTIGIILALFAKKSRFRELLRKSMSKTTIILLLLSSVFTVNNAYSQATASKDSLFTFDKQYADEFSKLVIVDMKGRMKPINTLAFEVVRKVTKQSSFNNLSPSQIFLGMSVNPMQWMDVPMIKIGHKKIQDLLKIKSDFASYSNLVTVDGDYLLKTEVERANALPVKNRTKYEKELIKVDERLNICNEILLGKMLNIYPTNSGQKWISPADLMTMEASQESQPIEALATNQFAAYAKAQETGDWSDAFKSLEQLKDFQIKNSGGHMPSQSKINIEILYNKINLFVQLSKIYGLVGIILLILIFIGIFNTKLNLRKIMKVSFFVSLLLFIVHTCGLLLRWYLSGHIPISNGYETLLFISWTTVLGGVLFSKHSPLTLAASSILAALSLAVASMSWMDPELTNLVPVLKSYWLIIHVTVITSSYGFFAIAAIAGLINVIVASLQTKNNFNKIRPTINELARMIEITVIIGLYLLTIGTFLGGVWANESWGRYWGWDPKETWALISILVYSIVFHMRKIPGMKGSMHISIASLIAFSSILMTYFGVNYFLSGMHSYAAGDAATVPSFVYYSAGAILVLIFLAVFGEIRSRKLIQQEREEENED